MSAHETTIHYLSFSCLSLRILLEPPVPGTPAKLNRGSIRRNDIMYNTWKLRTTRQFM